MRRVCRPLAMMSCQATLKASFAWIIESIIAAAWIIFVVCWVVWSWFAARFSSAVSTNSQAASWLAAIASVTSHDWRTLPHFYSQCCCFHKKLQVATITHRTMSLSATRASFSDLAPPKFTITAASAGADAPSNWPPGGCSSGTPGTPAGWQTSITGFCCRFTRFVADGEGDEGGVGHCSSRWFCRKGGLPWRIITVWIAAAAATNYYYFGCLIAFNYIHYNSCGWAVASLENRRGGLALAWCEAWRNFLASFIWLIVRLWLRWRLRWDSWLRIALWISACALPNTSVNWWVTIFPLFWPPSLWFL